MHVELDIEDAIIELNFQQLVNHVHNKYLDNSDFALASIKVTIYFIFHQTLRFLRRLANSVAYGLTRVAHSYAGHRIFHSPRNFIA